MHDEAVNCLFFFVQAFWREKGFSGEIVAGASTDCPFCVTFDATSPNGNAALVGFIAGQQASLWSCKEVIISVDTEAFINNYLCLLEGFFLVIQTYLVPFLLIHYDLI